MTVRRLVFFLFFLFSLQSPASADNFRPAYLQLTAISGEHYDVRWKTPAQSETVALSVAPIFPVGSEVSRPLVTSYAEGSAVTIGQVRFPGGLAGKTIRFDGLAESGNQALVRVVQTDGAEELYKVSPSDPKLTLPKQPHSLGISIRYTRLGIEHIMLGFDHLLFVAALSMLVANLRALFWTITSFTLAHSITLALVTFDAIRVPIPPVEAFIALSIIFVAVEILRQNQGRPTLSSRKPWLVAFAFGLLHGLGFASALAEIGLPRDNVPLALLFFNVGVELGQVVFVAALIAIAALARRWSSPISFQRARIVSTYGIGGLASFWLIDRIANFA